MSVYVLDEQAAPHPPRSLVSSPRIQRSIELQTYLRSSTDPPRLLLGISRNPKPGVPHRVPARHRGQHATSHAAQLVSHPGCTRWPGYLQVRPCSSGRIRTCPTGSTLHGSVLVLERYRSSFKLQPGTRQEIVNTLRLKPAYTPSDASPAQPSKRGRPRKLPPVPQPAAK